MEDDGLDGIVVGEPLKLRDHRLGLDDDALDVDHANLIAETAKGFLSLSSAQAQVNQREHRENEEEEGASADHDPQQGAGLSLFRHGEPLV